MYFADSAARAIYSWSYSRTGVRDSKVFLDLAGFRGVPDGATVDSEGCLWFTEMFGGRIHGVSTGGNVIATVVSSEERAQIAGMAYKDLEDLHLGLAMWIRNNVGLWKGNPSLLEACGTKSPDDASAFIVEAFWQHLRDLEPKLHKHGRRCQWP